MSSSKSEDKKRGDAVSDNMLSLAETMAAAKAKQDADAKNKKPHGDVRDRGYLIGAAPPDRRRKDIIDAEKKERSRSRSRSRSRERNGKRALRHLPPEVFAAPTDDNNDDSEPTTTVVDCAVWPGTLESLRGALRSQRDDDDDDKKNHERQSPLEEQTAEYLFQSPEVAATLISDVNVSLGLKRRDESNNNEQQHQPDDAAASAAAEEELDEHEVLSFFLDLLQYSPQYRVRSIALSRGRLHWSAGTQRALRLALEAAELRRKACLGLLPPSSACGDVAGIDLAAAAAAGCSRPGSATRAGRGSAADQQEESMTLNASGSESPLKKQSQQQHPLLLFSASSSVSGAFAPATTGALTTGDGDRTAHAAFVRADPPRPAPEHPTAESEAAALSAAIVSEIFAVFDTVFELLRASSVPLTVSLSLVAPSGATGIEIALRDPNPALLDLLVRVLRHCNANAHAEPTAGAEISALRIHDFENSLHQQQSSGSSSSISGTVRDSHQILLQLLNVCPTSQLRALDFSGTPLSDAHVMKIATRFLQPSRAENLRELRLQNCRLSAESVDVMCRCLEEENYSLHALDLRSNNLAEKQITAVVRAGLVHPKIKELSVFGGNYHHRDDESSSNNNKNNNFLFSHVVSTFFPHGAEISLHSVSKAMRRQLRRSLLEDSFCSVWRLYGEEKKSSSSNNNKKNATAADPQAASRCCIGLLCLALTVALRERMEKVEALMIEQISDKNNSNNDSFFSSPIAQLRDWTTERAKIARKLFGGDDDSNNADDDDPTGGGSLSLQLVGDVFDWGDAVVLLDFVGVAAEALLDEEAELLRKHNPTWQQQQSSLATSSMSGSSPLRSAGPPIALGATHVAFNGLRMTTRSKDDSRDFDVLASLVDAASTTRRSPSDDRGGDSPSAERPLSVQSQVSSASRGGARANFSSNNNNSSLGRPGNAFAQSLRSIHLGDSLWNAVFASSQHDAAADNDNDEDDEESAARKLEEQQARRRAPVLLPYLDEQIWKMMRLCPRLESFTFFPSRPRSSSNNDQQQKIKSPLANNNAVDDDDDDVFTGVAFDAIGESSNNNNAPITRVPTSSPTRSIIGKRGGDAKFDDDDEDDAEKHGIISRTYRPQMGAPVSEDPSLVESSSILEMSAKKSNSNSDSKMDAGAATSNSGFAPKQFDPKQQQQHQQRHQQGRGRQRSIVSVGKLARDNVLLSLLRDGGATAASSDIESGAGSSIMGRSGAGSGKLKNNNNSKTSNTAQQQQRRRVSMFSVSPTSPASPFSFPTGQFDEFDLNNNNAAADFDGDGSGGLVIPNRRRRATIMASQQAQQFQQQLQQQQQQLVEAKALQLHHDAESDAAVSFRVAHLRKMQHSIHGVLLSKVAGNSALHQRVVEVVCDGAKERAQQIVIEHSNRASSAAGGRTLTPSSGRRSVTPEKSPRPQRPTSSGGMRGAAAAMALRDGGGADFLQQTQLQQHQHQSSSHLHLNDAAVMSFVHLVIGADLFATIRSVKLVVPPAWEKDNQQHSPPPHLSWPVIVQLMQCLRHCMHLCELDLTHIATYLPQPWARALLEHAVAFFENAATRQNSSANNKVTLRPFKVKLVAADEEDNNNKHSECSSSFTCSRFVEHLQERLRCAEMELYGTRLFRALLPLAECGADIDKTVADMQGTSPKRAGAGGGFALTPSSKQQHQQRHHSPSPPPPPPGNRRPTSAPRRLQQLKTPTKQQQQRIATSSSAASSTTFAPPSYAHGLLRHAELEELFLRRWSTRASSRWTHLGLPHCGIGNRGVALLCRRFLLPGAELCPPLRIKRLDLRNNMIDLDDEETAQSLVAVVRRLRLTHLDLRENEIGAAGLAVFHEAIRSLSVPSLLTLVLPTETTGGGGGSDDEATSNKFRAEIASALTLSNLPVLRSRIHNAAAGKSLDLDLTGDCGDDVFAAAMHELAAALDQLGVGHALFGKKSNNNSHNSSKNFFHLHRVSVRACHLTEKSLPLLTALSQHVDTVVDWSLNRFAPASALVAAMVECIRQRGSKNTPKQLVFNVSGSNFERIVPRKVAAGLVAALETAAEQHRDGDDDAEEQQQQVGGVQLIADGWTWDDVTVKELAPFLADCPTKQQQQRREEGDDEQQQQSAVAAIDVKNGVCTVKTRIDAAVLAQVVEVIERRKSVIRKVCFGAGGGDFFSDEDEDDISSSPESASGGGGGKLGRAWNAFFAALRRFCSSSLESLSLPDCGLTLNSGFKQLMSFLHNNNLLSHLDLSKNFALTSPASGDCTALLLETLVAHNSSLRSIDVSGCGVVEEVVALVVGRVVPQWNSLGAVAKRDLAWIEQGLILSASAAAAAASSSSTTWFTETLFGGEHAAHFALQRAHLQQEQQPEPAEQKQRSNPSPKFFAESKLEEQEEASVRSGSGLSSSSSAGAPFNLCWSHGVASDAAIAALCESLRFAVVHAAETLGDSQHLDLSQPTFLTSVVVDQQRQKQQGGGSSSSSNNNSNCTFPLGALDISHCPGVTAHGLRLLKRLVADLGSSSSSSSLLLLTPTTGAPSRSPQQHPLAQGRSHSTVLPVTPPSELNAGMMSSSAASSSPSLGANSNQQLIGGATVFASSSARPSSASGRMNASSGTHFASSFNASVTEPPVEINLLGSSPPQPPNRHQHQVVTPVFTMQRQPQEEQHPVLLDVVSVPPALGIYTTTCANESDFSSSFKDSGRILHRQPCRVACVFRHIAADHCDSVPDFSALADMLVANRCMTATANECAGQKSSNSTTCQRIDFVSRCNLQPPTLRAALLFLFFNTDPAATNGGAVNRSGIAALPDELAYFPLATTAQVCPALAAAAAAQQQHDAKIAELQMLSAPASPDALTDDACFLIQRLCAISASLQQQPLLLLFNPVHLRLPRNELTSAGCAALVAGLCALPQPRLQTLDLGENEIGDAAAPHLAALLLHEQASIREVMLAANAFTDRAANVFLGCFEELRAAVNNNNNNNNNNKDQQQHQFESLLETFDVSNCPGMSSSAIDTVHIAAAVPRSGPFGNLCASLLDGTHNLRSDDLRTPGPLTTSSNNSSNSTNARYPFLLCVATLSQALLELRALDFSNLSLQDEDLGWHSAASRKAEKLRKLEEEDEDNAKNDADEEEEEEEEEEEQQNYASGVTPSAKFLDTEIPNVPLLFSALLQQLVVSAPKLVTLDVSHSKLSVHAAARLFSEVAPFVREAKLHHVGAFALHAKAAQVASIVIRKTPSLSGSASFSQQQQQLLGDSPSPSPARDNTSDFTSFGADEVEFLAAVCHTAYMSQNVAALVIGPCSENACRAALAPFPADLEVFVSLMIRNKLTLM